MFVSYVGIVSSIGEQSVLPGALVGAQQRPGAVWVTSAGSSSPPPFLDVWCLLRGASWERRERLPWYQGSWWSFHSKDAVLVTLRTAGASSL